MAKKKRRVGTPDAAAAVATEPGEMDCAVRAVQWAAGARAKSEQGLSLQRALKPLVLLRAAKYQLDAQAAKDRARPNAQAKKRLPEAPQPSPAEVSKALMVLERLAKQGEELLSPGCKALRAALHPLVETHLHEQKASPAFRITSMLSERSRWPEALRLLRELRQLPAEKRPRLGAYQRWVRELDVAEGDETELLMLDAVMRLAGGHGAAAAVTSGCLEVLEPWAPPTGESLAKDVKTSPPGTEPAFASTASKLFALISLRKASPRGPQKQLRTWRVLAHEKAADRMPPNHYDLDIYMCPPNVLPLDAPRCPAQRHEIPGIEGGCVLTDVLSPEECREWREATEEIGYRPDVPISSELDERAHNVVVMANDVQNQSMFDRVKHLLPEKLGDEKLLGLNRRWRFYRYLSGNLYRKHLDGAWPASGITVENGKETYVYNAHGGGTRSKLTFIIYLNDDFEGGCTTFFTPKPGEEGTLHSRPIRPRVGSASIFPHGDCRIPLLHEGSAVTKGTKYLLRTDVVYARPETQGELKHQVRLRGLARQLGGLGGFGGQGLLELSKKPVKKSKLKSKKDFKKDRKLPGANGTEKPKEKSKVSKLKDCSYGKKSKKSKKRGARRR